VRKILLSLLMAFLTSTAAKAQTVAPVWTECSNKCSGSFEITNNGLTPLQFTVETSSLRYEPGVPKLISAPLNSAVAIKLSESSGRLSPKETRRIFFQIQSNVTPYIIRFAAGFIAGHTANGLAVKELLPHTVYLDNNPKGARARILTVAGLMPTKK
jgi:hypothetical protein